MNDMVKEEIKRAKERVKELGFKTSKVDMTKRFIRFRQQPPEKFQRLRTIDPGRPGGTKLILGFPNGVQSVLIERKRR